MKTRQFFFQIVENSSRILDYFYKKVEELNLTENEFVNIFLHQNKSGETFLLKYLRRSNKNSEKCKTIIRFTERNYKKEKLSALITIKDQNDMNVILSLCNQDKETLKCIFGFLERNISLKDMRVIFNANNKNNQNLLQLAAHHAKSREDFEFLWLKISEYIHDKEEYFMRKGNLNFDINSLQLSAANSNDPEIFKFVFNLYKKNCSKTKFEKMIFKNYSNSENLLTWAARYALEENVKFINDEVLQNLNESKVIDILKTTKGKYGSNLLNSSLENIHIGSARFLWSKFEEFLAPDEIFKLVIEKDHNNDSILHHAAIFANTKEIFEFFWSNIEKKFKNDNELKMFLKLKAFFGRNALHYSIAHKNLGSFIFLFDEVYLKYFDMGELLLECDQDNENFMCYLARYGSLRMLETAFKWFKNRANEALLVKSFLKKTYQNIFHLAAISNRDESSIKFLIHEIERIVGQYEFQKMMSEKNLSNHTPHSLAMQENRFTNESIVNLFSIKLD